MLKMPDLTRVKVPGPPEELERLKAPLAQLKSSVVYARNDAVALTSVFYGAIIGPNVRLPRCTERTLLTTVINAPSRAERCRESHRRGTSSCACSHRIDR